MLGHSQSALMASEQALVQGQRLNTILCILDDQRKLWCMYTNIKLKHRWAWTFGHLQSVHFLNLHPRSRSRPRKLTISWTPRLLALARFWNEKSGNLEILNFTSFASSEGLTLQIASKQVAVPLVASPIPAHKVLLLTDAKQWVENEAVAETCKQDHTQGGENHHGSRKQSFETFHWDSSF